MTQFSVAIDKKQMAEVQSILGAAVKADKVYKRAVNDTLKRARSAIAKQTQSSLALKVADIRKKIKVAKSALGFSGVVTVSGSQVPLVKFYLSQGSKARAEKWIHAKPRTTRKPIRLQVRKGKTEVHQQAFFAQYKSGHLDIAQRDGNRRLPISTKWGASVKQGFEHLGKNLSVEDDLTSYLRDRVAMQMQLILEGKRK